MSMIKIIPYTTKKGTQPFPDWQAKLDRSIQAIIVARLVRVRLGNFGDCKLLQNSDGVWELRINHGPGYRVYFGKKGLTVIILLIGGDKKSQTRDIAKAKQYWLEYKESEND
jgi:putative addiction module killer protein